MATRHIKRLQQQLDASKAEDEPVASTEEESEEADQETKPFNPFDLLDEEEVWWHGFRYISTSYIFPSQGNPVSPS
jgi:hypothetical protein